MKKILEIFIILNKKKSSNLIFIFIYGKRHKSKMKKFLIFETICVFRVNILKSCNWVTHLIDKQNSTKK